MQHKDIAIVGAMPITDGAPSAERAALASPQRVHGRPVVGTDLARR